MGRRSPFTLRKEGLQGQRRVQIEGPPNIANIVGVALFLLVVASMVALVVAVVDVVERTRGHGGVVLFPVDPLDPLSRRRRRFLDSAFRFEEETGMLIGFSLGVLRLFRSRT